MALAVPRQSRAQPHRVLMLRVHTRLVAAAVADARTGRRVPVGLVVVARRPTGAQVPQVPPTRARAVALEIQMPVLVVVELLS